MSCYCSNDYDTICYHCQDAQDKANQQKVCESWNWNRTPRECAEDAFDKGWSLQTLQSAMKTFGFNTQNINQVVDEFESLSN